MTNFMDSYVDVAERIRKFKEQYPTGCLRPYNPEIPFVLMEIGGREFIVYTAACFRTPDDPMPAVAVAATLIIRPSVLPDKTCLVNVAMFLL